MPTLKDLTCAIELSESQHRLQEFGTTYGDGSVETFVPVPSKPQSFSIHLTSDRFIAPGISMYVFVDGVYQCNRNRQDLKLKKGSDRHSVVDFRVRQKEEKQKDGSMIARPWKFEKLDTSSADDAPDVCSPNTLDNIGCIEVLVLRCAGPRTAKTVPAMNMDGATDFPLPPFGVDSQPRHPDERSMFEDRSPVSGHTSAHRPPPPMPFYRSPYAETERSQSHSRHGIRPTINASPFSAPLVSHPLSRYSEPISPGARPVSVPSEAFQYGSGPVPAGPMMGSERSFYHTRPASAGVANVPGVDPAWLNELLTKAVKRGVEESRCSKPPTEKQTQHIRNAETASQPPGAWPESPFGLGAQPVQSPEHNSGSKTNDSDSVWGGDEAPKKTKSRVNWSTQPDWGSQAKAVVWSTPEEPFSDTWDTDETWGTEKSKGQQASQWGQSKPPSTKSRPETRNVSPNTERHQQASRSQRHSSRKSRSKSRSRHSGWGERHEASSEDRNRWNQVDAASDSSRSTNSTLMPRKHVRGSRNGSRSKKGSKRTRSAHSKSNRSGFYLRGGADSHAPSTRIPAPSVGSGAAPTIMTGDPFMQQPIYTPHTAHQAGSFARAAPHAPQAPPIWVPETYKPPAPFGVAANTFTRIDQGTKVEDSWDDTDTGGRTGDHWEVNKKSGDDWGMWGTDWEAKSISKKNSKNADGWGAGFGFGDTTKEGAANWETTADPWNNANSKSTTKKEKSVAWGPTADAWDSKNKSDEFPTKDTYTPWDTKDNTWDNDKLNGIQWAETRAPSSTSPKPAPPSKRHTSKSLSQYRKHRSPSLHWQFPPSPSPTPLPSLSPSTILPAEPLLKLSAKQASEKRLEHQVRAGTGTQYGHAISRPSYLDTLEKPYAVFRFKYRSRAVLKDLFGEAVPDTGRLSTRTPSGRIGRTEEWVRLHSREASENGRKDKGYSDPNKWM